MILFLRILHIALYIVDIPKILRDNHVTIAMEEGTVKKEFQEDLVVRKPNIIIYLLSLQTLHYAPLPPPLSDFGKNNY